MMKGIDISKWQGSIDFSKVARNVEFAILREGYRKAIDERFLEYVAGCKSTVFRFGVFIIFATPHQPKGQKKRRFPALQISRRRGLTKILLCSLILSTTQ